MKKLVIISALMALIVGCSKGQIDVQRTVEKHRYQVEMNCRGYAMKIANFRMTERELRYQLCLSQVKEKSPKIKDPSKDARVEALKKEYPGQIYIVFNPVQYKPTECLRESVYEMLDSDAMSICIRDQISGIEQALTDFL